MTYYYVTKQRTLSESVTIMMHERRKSICQSPVEDTPPPQRLPPDQRKAMSLQITPATPPFQRVAPIQEPIVSLSYQ